MFNELISAERNIELRKRNLVLGASKVTKQFESKDTTIADLRSKVAVDQHLTPNKQTNQTRNLADDESSEMEKVNGALVRHLGELLSRENGNIKPRFKPNTPDKSIRDWLKEAERKAKNNN